MLDSLCEYLYQSETFGYLYIRNLKKADSSLGIGTLQGNQMGWNTDTSNYYPTVLEYHICEDYPGHFGSIIPFTQPKTYSGMYQIKGRPYMVWSGTTTAFHASYSSNLPRRLVKPEMGRLGQ